MAIDLIFGKTKRYWAMPARLVISPAPAPTPVAPDPTLTALTRTGIRVEKRGRGAVVSKKWKWG